MDDFMPFLILWIVFVLLLVGVASSESGQTCNYVAADHTIMLFNCDSND